MGKSTKRPVPIENQLLAALPEKEYLSLLPELEHVPLAFKEILYQPGARIEHVYFPSKGLIALTSPINKRSTTAVSLIGNDGMTGISVFLGEAKSHTPAIVLVAGAALRMKASVLQKSLVACCSTLCCAATPYRF